MVCRATLHSSLCTQERGCSQGSQQQLLLAATSLAAAGWAGAEVAFGNDQTKDSTKVMPGARRGAAEACVCKAQRAGKLRLPLSGKHPNPCMERALGINNSLFPQGDVRCKASAL